MRRSRAPGLHLDGCGFAEGAFPTLVAAEPRLLAWAPSGPPARDALSRVEARIAERRRRGGPGGTGVALALAYEALGTGGAPALLALEVDASVVFDAGVARSVAVGGVAPPPASVLGGDRPENRPPLARARSLRTSLPREAYLRAAVRVKRHIERGDVYQANLTQRFEAVWTGNAADLFASAVAATPAPRAALVEVGDLALVSVSPETFVDVDADGAARTVPIKGTRARGRTAEEDRARAAELFASEKDRAELTMIVDLERNDLGRVAEPGSVAVPDLCLLRSYAAVHHLVAKIEARVRGDVGLSGLIEAVFPGGSITGAPKIRAMQILRELEPVPRGLYTGSLFWLDDDKTTVSSILIRSAVVAEGVVRIGAGGGVVADSDPEAEWMESNAKARALTRLVGFEPEEAS